MDVLWNALRWIEGTGLATWLREGDIVTGPFSAFYVTLGIHSIGMVMVVGVTFMISVRLLGYFQEFPLNSINRWMRFAWVGFYINLASGILLLVAQPRREFMTMTFNLKILMIVGAVTTMIAMQRALREGDLEASADGTAVLVPGRARAAAMICNFFWLGAIISGRLIGYTQPPPPF